MSVITQTVRVDLNTGKVLPTVFTHQNDTDRKINFAIFNNGIPYDLTSSEVKLMYKSPPYNGGYTVITGNNAIVGSVSGNVASIHLTSSYLQVAGVALLTLLITTNGSTIRPINIKMVVQESPDGLKNLVGASDFPSSMWADAREWMRENLLIGSYLDFLNAMMEIFKHVAYVDENALTYYRIMVNKMNALKFTNLVVTSTDGSGNIFDGVGYRNGYYMSGGVPSSTQDANCTITGYIPIAATDETGIGDVYRIMGVGEPSSSHTRMALVKSNFSNSYEVNSFLSGSAGGPMGCFTLTTETVNGVMVYCLTVSQKISSSYSNIGYIRFSFDGTDGGDVIITYNEEIY